MGSAVSAHNLTPKQEYELYVHLHEACNEKLITMGVLEAKVPLDQEIMKTDLVAIREEIHAATTGEPIPGGRPAAKKQKTKPKSKGKPAAAANDEVKTSPLSKNKISESKLSAAGAAKGGGTESKAADGADGASSASSSAVAGGGDEEEAAAKLQAVQRGTKARQELAAQKAAATKVQAVVRGQAERQKDKEVDGLLQWDNGDHGGADVVPGTAEEEHAATVLQARMRQKKAKMETFKKKEHQLAEEQFVQRSIEAAEKEEQEEAAVALQAAARGRLAKKHAKEEDQAAVKVQAAARGRLAQKKAAAAAAVGGGGSGESDDAEGKSKGGGGTDGKSTATAEAKAAD